MPSKFDPQKHHRQSIRLQGYDYSQVGAYFVTIVTFQRDCLFGEIIEGEMVLNEMGKIIQKWWDDLPAHFPGLETGAFVIMPNHVHGIIIIIALYWGRIGISGRKCSKYSGRGNSAPTKQKTNVGTNRGLFQIPIHQRD